MNHFSIQHTDQSQSWHSLNPKSRFCKECTFIILKDGFKKLWCFSLSLNLRSNYCHPEKIQIVTPDISLNMSYLYLKKLYENTRALKNSNCFIIRSLNNSKLLSLDQHWHLHFLLFVEIHVYTKRLTPHTSSKLCLTWLSLKVC